MIIGVFLTVNRCLSKCKYIRKAAIKICIKLFCRGLKNFGKVNQFFITHSDQCSMALFRKHVGLIRKPGKIGNECNSTFILRDDPDIIFFFRIDYIAENISILFFSIFGGGIQFFSYHIDRKVDCIYLAMRMWIRYANYLTLIFKDQNGLYGFMIFEKDHFITQGSINRRHFINW